MPGIPAHPLCRSVYGNPLNWRLHGKKSYSYRYTDEDLGCLNEMLADRSAYVMFNNVSMKEDSMRFAQFYGQLRRRGGP
jgi:uncharacterized protein YecE (DUF72 family)